MSYTTMYFFVFCAWNMYTINSGILYLENSRIDSKLYQQQNKFANAIH